jgi:hypothetical protein
MPKYAWLADALVAKGWEAAIVQPLADALEGSPELRDSFPGGLDNVIEVKVTKLSWAASMPVTRQLLDDIIDADTIVRFLHDRLVRAWSEAVFKTGV